MPSAAGWRRRLIAALSSTLAAEQERWFPWSVAAFGAGIAAYFGLLAEPSWFIVGGVVVSCMAVGAIGAITANMVLRFTCALHVASGLGLRPASCARRVWMRLSSRATPD